MFYGSLSAQEDDCSATLVKIVGSESENCAGKVRFLEKIGSLGHTDEKSGKDNKHFMILIN